MRYNCFNCGNTLNIPTQLEIDAKLKPVRLQCPHCGSKMSLRFRAASFDSEDVARYPLRLLVRFLHILRNRTFLSEVSPTAVAEIQSRLSSHIVERFSARYINSFWFINGLAWFFFLVGIWQVAQNSNMTAGAGIFIWGALLFLVGCAVVLYHYYGRDYLANQGIGRDWVSFPAQLHWVITIALFFVLMNVGAQFVESGYIINHNKTNNIMAFRWVAGGIWLLLNYVLLLAVGHRTYIYAILGSLFFYHCGEFLYNYALLGDRTVNYLESPFVGFGAATPPAIFLFLLHLVVGPLFSYFCLRTYSFFRPAAYDADIERNSVLLILAQVVVISFYTLLATRGWEHVTFFGIFLAAAIVLTALALRFRNRVFGYWSLFYFALSVYSANQAMAWQSVESIYGFFVPVLLLLLSYGIYARLSEGSGLDLGGDIDLVPSDGFLGADHWRIQTVVAWLAVIVAYLSAWKSDHVYYFSIFLFLYGVAGVYLYHFKTSKLAKYTPWLLIGLSLSMIIIRAELFRFGVAWMLLAFVLFVIASIWKIYFSYNFIEQLKLNFHEVEYEPRRRPVMDVMVEPASDNVATEEAATTSSENGASDGADGNDNPIA